MKSLKVAVGLIVVCFIATFLYGAKGYVDALDDTAALAVRADRLIAQNLGASGLGQGRMEQLLQVEDPGFWDHSGVDLTTAGAGITTMTQSLAKRVGFENWQPGIRKVRQTGYALGLEGRLSKSQIIALFLDTAEMGRGPDGWITGFFDASEAVFGRSVAELDDRDFLSLVAVLIAPARFDLTSDDPDLTQRVSRIERLISDSCYPKGLSDVWFDGCA